MLGGLYGDLPPPSSSEEEKNNTTSNSTSTVWSSTSKMAPPTLRKPSSLPQSSVLLKPHNLASSHVKLRPQQPKLSTPPSVNESPLVSFQAQQHVAALVGVTSTVIEEYDPGRPNDYEEYRREKKKKAMEAEMKKELEKRRQEEEEREREKRERAALERENERDSLNISGEEAWKRRAAMSGGGAQVVSAPRSPGSPPSSSGGGDGFSIGKSGSVGLGVGAGGNMTAAQRMMAKMGWKEGQGLGKQEQGITTPLMAKKTDRRAGVIVNASAEKKLPKSVNLNGPPTRVLLLRNMVGPGEVDDELEDEVASECAKYGTVTRVLIFEITEQDFPVEEAVRIFVQFERSEETTKALVDLDGRFFGGRVVRATFYDEERFAKNELAPLSGEVPGFS